MSPSDRSPSYIYFIRPVGMPGPVKVGFSKSVERRLQGLMAWSPFALEIAATIPGGFDLEQKIQRHLFRSHSHREWFHPTAEVVAMVAALKDGAAIEDAIDFSAPSGTIQSQARRRREPSFGKFMSYFHRIRFAMDRAAKARGVDRLLTPRSVYAALEKIKGGIELSEKETALLEGCVANPESYGKTYAELYPPRAGA